MKNDSLSQRDFVNALAYDIVCKFKTFDSSSKYVQHLETVRSKHQHFKTHYVDVYVALGDIYIEDVDLVITKKTKFGIYYVDDLRLKFITDWS